MAGYEQARATSTLAKSIKTEDDINAMAPVWFVGAPYGGIEDQTRHFIKAGIGRPAQHGPKTTILVSFAPCKQVIVWSLKLPTLANIICPSTTRVKWVAVMNIKAIGMVTKNHDNGRLVDVNWEPCLEPINEWYFHTFRNTVWKITPGKDWQKDALIDFTFNSGVQHLERCLNDHPCWKSLGTVLDN